MSESKKKSFVSPENETAVHATLGFLLSVAAAEQFPEREFSVGSVFRCQGMVEAGKR